MIGMQEPVIQTEAKTQAVRLNSEFKTKTFESLIDAFRPKAKAWQISLETNHWSTSGRAQN
jgi:hypothetical protein